MPVTPSDLTFSEVSCSLHYTLGLGVLFATFVILLLVPCLYMIVDDVANRIASFKAWVNNAPSNV